jgi:hypothetical protein
MTTLREAAERLDSEVRTVASFLVGYGDVAELAAARLRKASREFDEAALAAQVAHTELREILSRPAGDEDK